MRVADLIVFVIDVDKILHLQMLLDELKALSVLINKQKPKIFIRETQNAIGLLVEANRSKLSEREIQTVLSEFGIHNARIRIDENITIEELISFVSSKNHYMKAIVALNKIDLSSNYERIANAMLVEIQYRGNTDKRNPEHKHREAKKRDIQELRHNDNLPEAKGREYRKAADIEGAVYRRRSGSKAAYRDT